MNKRTLVTLGFLTLPSFAQAECPSLEVVIPQLQTITQALKTKSLKPIQLNGKNHTVHYGRTGKAVDDLLAGKFKGYTISRLEETIPGECEYLLHDDNTPAMGSFYLKYTPSSD